MAINISKKADNSLVIKGSIADLYNFELDKKQPDSLIRVGLKLANNTAYELQQYGFIRPYEYVIDVDTVL